MRVAVVGIVGIPGSYGGFETMVDNLVEMADKDSVEFLVFCSSINLDKKLESYKGAKLEYLPLKANGVSSVFYDGLSIVKGLFLGERNFLILGVSGCVWLPVVKVVFSDMRVVTNIDGVEWRREKWGWLSSRFLKLSEFLAVKFSDAVICDNQGIAEYVAQEYGAKSYVIPYGGEHALEKVNQSQKNRDFRYALSICRIEPENNVHMVLSAFKSLDLHLKFVGNWDASKYGKALKKEYSVFPNIELINPIYDSEMLGKIRQDSSVYIHGHSAGGTNPSLVEMMFFATPIIAFDCIYNRYTLDNMGWFFKTEDELAILITETEFPAEIPEISDLAFSKYTWYHVFKDYGNIFNKYFLGNR